jgi:hypothetical protein
LAPGARLGLALGMATVPNLRDVGGYKTTTTCARRTRYARVSLATNGTGGKAGPAEPERERRSALRSALGAQVEAPMVSVAIRGQISSE